MTALPDAIKPRQGDALIITDVQNDFLAGGRLAVPDGDAVVPILNRYIEIFKTASLPIFVIRDWHPPNHCSFLSQGGIWPSHCVAGSYGAEFSPNLRLPFKVTVISKASTTTKEAYSGLDSTDLDQQLRSQAVCRVFVGGLATDYCVLATVKDFLIKGYAVILLTDAVRAVNVQPGDGKKAEEEMLRLGAEAKKLEEIL